MFPYLNNGVAYCPSFRNTQHGTASQSHDADQKTTNPSPIRRRRACRSFRTPRYPTNCTCHLGWSCGEYQFFRLCQTVQRNNRPFQRVGWPWVYILLLCLRFMFDLSIKSSVHATFDFPRVVVIGGQSSKRPGPHDIKAVFFFDDIYTQAERAHL